MTRLQAADRWHGLPYKGKTTWYTRKLSDGSWLAVHHESRGRWSWAHRGPDYVGEVGDRTSRVRAEGFERSAADARAAADRYLRDLGVAA